MSILGTGLETRTVPTDRVDLAATDAGLNALVQRLGFWSAITAAIFSIAFTLGAIVGALFFPQANWTGDITAFAAKYNPTAMELGVVPSVLLAPAFLSFAVAVHSGARAEKRPLALLALLFATLYVATVGINYFLQLSVVRQNLMTGTTDAMGLFAMSNTQSVFWALEFLGYFWQGAATLLMAAHFVGRGIGRWTRWMLIAVFASGALGVVAAVRGTTFNDPVFIVGGAVWALCFPAAMILGALYFRRTAPGVNSTSPLSISRASGRSIPD